MVLTDSLANKIRRLFDGADLLTFQPMIPDGLLDGSFRKRIILLLAFSLATSAILCLPAFLMPWQRDFYRRNFPDYFNSWTHNGSFSLADSFYMALDNYTYAAHVQHAGSHSLPGDPFIKENTGWRMTGRDFLSYYILGGIFRLAGDMPTTWVVVHVLFAFLWVPCLYLLIRQMGAAAELAVFIAVVSTVLADMTRLTGVFPYWHALRDALQYFFWPIGSYTYWFGPLRLTRPLLTYPCLFAAASLFIWADKSRSKTAALASGVAGGALAYIHPDVWAGYIGASVLFGAYSFRRDRTLPRLLLVSLATTFFISAPMWLLGLWSVQDPASTKEFGREPEWSSLIYLAAILACWSRIKINRMALWIACLLGALFGALNIHVLLGWRVGYSLQNLWFDLCNTFAPLLLSAHWLEKLKLKRETWLWAAACMLLLALPRAFNYSTLHYKMYALPRHEEEAYGWLKKNTPKDSVVAALSVMTNLRIPVHTHNKVLTAPALVPMHSELTPAENADRLINALNLFGVDIKKFSQASLDCSSRWESRLWVGEIDAEGAQRCGAALSYFPPTASSQNFLSLLQEALARTRHEEYAADYLWFGPFERELAPRWGRPSGRSGWEKVYENPSIAIFRSPDSQRLRNTAGR